MKDLERKVAIVTGAGTGIGRETALALATRGASLIVNDCAHEAADAAVNDIRRAGGTACAEYSAVGTTGSADKIIAAALNEFDRLDILVNNAGISRPAPFGEGTDADIELVFAVNLLGPYGLMRRAWPIMKSHGGGAIVNTASSAALGSGASGAYAPSKAGIIGLTKEAAIAGEAHGIRVNAIMPSASTTLLDKHPSREFRAWMERHFPPRLVASATSYLASDQCRLTGQVLTVGGGHVARLSFRLGKGITDPSLDMESLARNIDAVMADDRGTELLFQRDLQAVYFDLFPS